MGKIHAWVLAMVAVFHIAEGQARQRKSVPLTTEIGQASWYGWYHHGRLTADGSRFDALGNTAASLTLPLGTLVKVTNLENDKTVQLRITDRGPYVKGRILDVSMGAAARLGMLKTGVATVMIEPIGK